MQLPLYITLKYHEKKGSRVMFIGLSDFWFTLLSLNSLFLVFFKKGFLDEQFNQLQQLQDESNPDFVVEVVTLFFEDAERLLNELSKTL